MLRHILRLRTRNFNAQHLQSLFYCTSSFQIKPSFSKYLVDSLGFTHHQSLSTSSKLAKLWQTDRVDGQKKVSNFKFAENANCVFNFFMQHGFTDAQIRNVVTRCPRILAANVEKTLIPKFRALQEHGFSGSHLVDIISGNAYLLERGLDSIILPAVRTLREVLGMSDDEVVSSLKNFRRPLGGELKNMEMNVALLRSYGLPIEVIRKQLCIHPSAYAVKPEMFEKTVIKVELKLGIPRHSKMILFGIQLLISLSDNTFDSKIEAFKSFGWTESDVLALCRKQPTSFRKSVLTIRKKLGFLMNELGYKPADIISNSCTLTYSLEKRVVLRHNVLMVLKQKGLVTDDCSFLGAVRLTEPRFFDKFVLSFPEVHQLYAKQMGISVKNLILE